MFYLKEFFLIARDHKMLSLVNMLLLASVVAVTQYRGDIKHFFAVDSKASVKPYFNALFEGNTNPDYIIRKMSNLPGVAHVEFKDDKKLAKELKGFASEIGADAALATANFKSFKIDLDNGLQLKSSKLIKEYFSRLVGGKDVTFSKVKRAQKWKIKESPLYSMFSKWSDLYIGSIAAVAWLFTLWLMSQSIQAQSFVIEKFQRKERTALKIYALLAMVPVLLSVGCAFILNNKADFIGLAPAIGLIAVGCIFFITKKKPQRFI